MVVAAKSPTMSAAHVLLGSHASREERYRRQQGDLPAHAPHDSKYRAKRKPSNFLGRQVTVSRSPQSGVPLERARLGSREQLSLKLFHRDETLEC